MDIGNVALTITHLIVLLSIWNMSYQLIKIKSSVSRKGYKNTIIKLLITEIVMILCGILYLWVILYPPFAAYTWNKVFNDIIEKLIMIERVIYLLGIIVILPTCILILLILMCLKKKKRNCK